MNEETKALPRIPVRGRGFCTTCEGQGWVCEDHPLKPWSKGDGCCGGAGMLCPECFDGEGRMYVPVELLVELFGSVAALPESWKSAEDHDAILVPWEEAKKIFWLASKRARKSLSADRARGRARARALRELES